MSNIFCAVGSLGKDSEVKTTASGQAVLSFSVANNIGYGDKQKTLWVRCTVWGKRAESNLKTFLVKGQQVFVSGELTVSEYQGNDGTKQFSLELNCNIVDLVGKRTDNAPAPVVGYAPQPPPPPQAYQPQQSPHQQHQQAVAQYNQSHSQADDDSIPF